MPPTKFRRKTVSRKRRPSVVKLIKKVIKQQAEHKFQNITGGSASLTDIAPFVGALNAVANGNTAETRIGDDINVTHINLRYNLFLDDANTKNLVRVYVIQSLNDDPPLALPDTPVALMPNLPDAINNYRILYDKTHQMSLGINVDIIRMIRLNGRKMIKTEFRDVGLLDFTKGRIDIHFITNNIVTNNIQMSFQARMVFTDV